MSAAGGRGPIGDAATQRPVTPTTLVTTMLIMGVATFLMGAIPTYEQVGIAAPILLIVLRLAQGLAIGGEWGGPVLMAVEYAPPRRRGFYGSFPQLGLAVGLVLGTGVRCRRPAQRDRPGTALPRRDPPDDRTGQYVSDNPPVLAIAGRPGCAGRLPHPELRHRRGTGCARMPGVG